MVKSIERLEFNKPPPGYARVTACFAGLTGTEDKAAVAAAWAHFKERHDPPGMKVEFREGIGYGFRCEAWTGGLWAADGLSREHARAAAWTWHDRRHALAKSIDAILECPYCDSREPVVEHFDDGTCSQPWCVECDAEMGGLSDVWPEVLTWSDGQVAATERYLAKGGEIPEALRG